ncbi:MAG: sigma-54 dependent transcriptional regulator [Gemmatimonadota bacterium]
MADPHNEAGRSGETVLIVEDDESLCALLQDEVAEAGYTVETANSAEEAERLLSRLVPDLIISDLRLPGANGKALLAFSQSLRPRPAFLVVTAFGTVNQAVECLKLGADDFLVKPLDLDHLMMRVGRLLENRRLRLEVQQYHELLGSDSFHGMIGRSKPMRALFDQVRSVARAKGPALIVGESGVGKEMVARAIHRESARSRRPFVAVNAAGIPGELLESEIFGHESGAFTGATRARKGLFEEADGGTIFLDEIGEMPAALQAKLLRVLQDGMVRPVGANRERRVDVRIVTATNRNMERAVEDGSFREDLYFRLETFLLRVPPLRERVDDLELLTARFLKLYAGQMDREIGGLSPRAVERLKRYGFPGNVRELQSAIERAVAFCSGSTIRVEDLPGRIRKDGKVTAGDWGPLESLLGGTALPTAAELEAQYIRYVLGRVEGNKRQASKLLGISRRTLYRRLEEMELSVNVDDADQATD